MLALCYREKSTLSFGPFPKINWNDRKEAQALLEELVEQFPNVPEYRFDLSETLALMDLRGPFFSFPASPGLEKDFQEALRLSKELVTEHPNVPDYKFSKANIHYRLGLLQKANKELDKAESNLLQALDLQTTLAQRFPKMDLHLFLKIRFQDELINVLLDQKKWAESRPLLESSISQLKKMIAKDVNAKFLHFALADDSYKLAKALYQLDDPELANYYEHQAEEIRRTHGFGFSKKKGGKGPGQKGE
jgi:tetratricopeptide (TPR) repeat protein